MVVKKPHQGDTAQDDSWTVFRELGGPSVKKGMRKTGSGKPSKSLQFPPLSPMTPLSPIHFFFLMNLFGKYRFLFGISLVLSLHHSNSQQTAARTTGSCWLTQVGSPAAAGSSDSAFGKTISCIILDVIPLKENIHN